MRTRRTEGFTLLELLVTMAILGMLSVLGMVGYASAVRGMRERAATRGVESLLDLARRRAEIEETPTVVFFRNRRVAEEADGAGAGVGGEAGAVRAGGRISLIAEGLVSDESADWEKGWPCEGGDAGGHRLYRLAENGAVSCLVSNRVYPISRAGEKMAWTDADAASFPPAYGFKILDGCADWRIGDVWGEELASITLPPGLLFGSSQPSAAAAVEVARVSFDGEGRQVGVAPQWKAVAP
ncbi:MAG: type II secretion system GspH family protein [Kiritimatiellae bacterium]|nr:type II secretion system GspH family protein [Kiritimatiellia bacterium]